MDVYKYNVSNAVNGFSVNDQLWVNAEVSGCDDSVEPETTCKDCSTTTTPTCETCMMKATCKNGRLRREQYQATGANGRYVDTQNLYVFQVLHGVNLFHGICLLAFLAYRYNKG